MDVSIDIATIRISHTGQPAFARKPNKSASMAIDVVDYGQHSLAVICPKVTVRENTLLTINGQMNFANKQTEFEFTGKVLSLEPLEDSRCSLQIELFQFDRKLWESFLVCARAGQQKADQIIKAIKGEDGDGQS